MDYGSVNNWITLLSHQIIPPVIVQPTPKQLLWAQNWKNKQNKPQFRSWNYHTKSVNIYCPYGPLSIFHNALH